MTTIRILFFLLAAVVSRAQTPESEVSLADTQQRTLTPAKIGQRYELLVSLPAGYAKSGESYPVLYVLDGWHFPLMAFIQENNVYSKRMRPVIIVYVNHGATDYMALRARDFTPTRTHELIPFVDRTWRTKPTDRGLLGHSYGGLFAIYALALANCTNCWSRSAISWQRMTTEPGPSKTVDAIDNDYTTLQACVEGPVPRRPVGSATATDPVRIDKDA